MSDTNRLIDFCSLRFRELEFHKRPALRKRLEGEIRDTINKGDAGYFLKLQQECDEKKVYYRNEHNTLVPYLLGVCKTFDADATSACDYGEFPDVDVDYIDGVREHVKDVFAPEKFGSDYVCGICTYSTNGVKGAMKDMARIFNVPHQEVELATKGVKETDADGKELTWEQTLEIYDNFRQFCEAHPEVADAARRMIGRIRTQSQHASGLVVSSVPISDFIPLLKDPEGRPVSAWPEGQSASDLSTVGFVKFDFLGLAGNQKIATTCRLACEAKKNAQVVSAAVGDMTVCALPGLQEDGTPWPSWSDTAYLNDPKCMEMARRGDLRMVFQFDGSPGIRRLARDIGITNFDDMVACTSLYRPGPMKLGAHEQYAKRKNGKEEWSVHPALAEGPANLSFTFNVVVFQEQIARILNTVGKIPLSDCETVRKAISKKKIEKFKKYKDMFIENGQKVLGATVDYLEELWSLIEAFAGYGFNQSIKHGTLIPSVNDGTVSSKAIQDFVPGDLVLSIDESGSTIETEIVALHDHGTLDGYEVTFDDGYSITCTLDHKFLTRDGQKPLREILLNDSPILSDQSHKKDIQNATGERDNCQVRPNIQNKRVGNKTPILMPRMPKISVANGEVGRTTNNSRTQVSVRAGIREVATHDRPSEVMSRVRGSQTSQHHCQKFEDQPVGRSSQGVFRSGKKDFGPSGNTGRSCGELAPLARSQPGRICNLYQIRPQIPQTLQDGTMAPRTTALEYGLHRVGRLYEASRLSEWQCLDRDRRILSLQRAASQVWQESATSMRARTRCRSKCGGSEARGHYAHSSKHEMLCRDHRGNEARLVGNASGHAPITDTRRLVPRRILRVMPVGKQRMYDLEVDCPTHNFILPTGIVTSNSHGVGYTYLSARMLWLKCHLPVHFFTSMFSFTKTSKPEDYQNLKDYKQEGERMGVHVLGVDVNKSKAIFSSEGNNIYYGFEKIRGIGEAAAKRLESFQPYTSFEDLLARFGDAASVVLPLIALGAFPEYDRVTLYKFYEHYKRKARSEVERHNRYANNIRRYRQQQEDARQAGDFALVETIERKILKSDAQRDRTDRFATLPTLADFNPEDVTVKLKDSFLEILRDETGETAQKTYYGYQLTHAIERCPNYQGHTIGSFEGSGDPNGFIEVEITDVVEKKGPRSTYYSVAVEDAAGEKRKVTVWSNEYERFQDELRTGRFVRLHVDTPKQTFFPLNLHQFGRWRQPRREQDNRVVQLN